MTAVRKVSHMLLPNGAAPPSEQRVTVCAVRLPQSAGTENAADVTCKRCLRRMALNAGYDARARPTARRAAR